MSNAIQRHAGGILLAGTSLLLVSKAPSLAQDLRGSYASSDTGGMELRSGAMVGFRPKYEGSDEYQVFALPMIMPVMQNSGAAKIFKRFVSVQGTDDVRFRLIRYNGFEAGPLAGYNFGRDQDDADRLAGLGDVDDGLVVGGYVAYNIGLFGLDMSYHHQATGDVDGYQLRFGVITKFAVSETIRLNGRVGATFADDNYMQAYFGVSSAQAAASTAQLQQSDAGSGIKDVHVEVGAQMQLLERWQLTTSLRYSRLIGDAANSPVIETEDQLSGRLGLTYRFGLPW